MEKEDYIAVTHFINPHLFWYHKIDVQTPGFKELQRIEESVQLLYTAKQSAALLPHRPIVGEVVAIAFLSWNKFIRARVEYIAKYTKAEDEYVVWALDYGFPFRTKRIYIRKLPESYAMQTDHIRKGGIANLIPADTEFDLPTTTNKLVCKNSWSKKPVELLEKVMNDAASISFIEMFALDGRPTGVQHFGDLKIVNHMGVEFMGSDYLLKLSTAMKCSHGFKEKIATLKTNSIPCWQTNSGDMKIIENKLNSFNVDYVHQGNFNLSGNFSEFSCDNFAKQKVMDWCQRNQNLDKTERDGHPISPLTYLDASDFSFDDSVSVNNYKEQGLHMTYEDTYMGCAGTLRESMRKRYQGKALPPKPSIDVFEVIPEKEKHSGEKQDTHSSESVSDAPSERMRALLELRKKLQKESQKDKSCENEAVIEAECLKSGSQSESGTEEFLQICKEINAQSTRLAKLRELRTRRITGANSNSEIGEDAHKKDAPNKVQNQGNEDTSESCATSTKSSRLLLLEKIKKKHSKQFVPAEETECDKLQCNHTTEEETNLRSQAESVVSTHAAKLINMRKKIKEKYSQESQLVCDNLTVNKSCEIAIPDSTKKNNQTMQQQSFKFIEHTILDHDVSQVLSTTPIEEKSVKKQNPKSIDRRNSGDDNASTVLSSDVSGVSTNDEASSQVSYAREAELRKMRQMIRSNPLQVMTMVPGGYDVTKLSKRNNEESHWHTKKTTLNDSAHSNQSSSAGYQNNNSSKDSSHNRSVARRTEDVEEQNFRFTRSRKERKKPQLNKSEGEKNILDASFMDDLVPAPTILPQAITDKAKRNVPDDLMVFIDNETNKDKPTDHGMVIDLCKEDKLINLSDTSESTLHISSTESNVVLPENELSAKDSSEKKLKAISQAPCEDSFDLMNLETPEKTLKTEEFGDGKVDECQHDSLSIPNVKMENRENKNGDRMETKKREFCVYEASSSSASSGTVDKTITSNLPTSENHHTSKSTSISSSESAVSMQRLLKSSLVDEECSKLITVGSYKQYQSSSSSSSSFVKINPDEAFTRDTQEAKGPACLPSVTSKLRNSTSDRLNSSSSTELSNKVSASSTQLSSGSGENMETNDSNVRLPQVAGEASLKTNLIDHLVLAHSHAKVSPIENMTSAMFAPVVHREMENMRLTKMYRIQSYAWAHLIRGNSFFVVNPARTGKSWCYLPPICSMVNYRTESNELPQSYGPVAVIIAPSSIQVENISRQCRRLLASSLTKISVVPSYAFRNSEDVKIELHNGCGILIITPPSLRRLLLANESESLLNMERIQFVVLDDLDMMTTHYSEFSETLNKFFGPVLRQECGKVRFQLVVTSKRWSPHIVNLLKISSQPMLCIGDFLEAAVYAKSKISIKLQCKSEKMSVMIKFLQKYSYSVERVVIVCNAIEEVDEVEKNLIEGGLACLLFTERTPLEYQNLIHEWKIKAISNEILVTMDSVLPELMIQNATILIHYSLPKSWTKFNFRFSVFLQKHHNLIKNAFEKADNFVKSVVLLDEENNIQLPRLIEFMKHHDQLKHIHPDILNVASRVTAEREEARVKNGILMCPNVLEFGSCDENSRCSHRHQLTKYDAPLDDIPTEGEVRIKILDVLSPTHYIARLLTHKIEDKWQVVRRSNEVPRFLLRMLLHFTIDGTQVVYWPLKVNEMCVFKSGDTFHRCRILEVPTIVHENIVKVVNVKVKLIDSGSVIMCKSNALLVISEDLVDFPAQAVDIRLSGVKPFDNERVWDTRSTRTVKNWIMNEVRENDCLQASINFALMDTIWVHNVVLMEKLATIRGYALKVNVKRSLIGKEFAVAEDAEHLVKKIALQNGLLQSDSIKEELSPSSIQSPIAEPDSPYIEENLMEFSSSISEEKDVSSDFGQKSNKESVNPEVSTADQRKRSAGEASEKLAEVWMQLGQDELNKIEIGEFKDSEEFYVHLTRQGNELQELETLIKQQQKNPLDEPCPMQSCLAPRDGVYHRAKIQRLEVSSSDGQVRARVFFCDLGEFSTFELSELCCSNKELTEFIPYQAVTCKLTGILCTATRKEIQNLIPKSNCVYFAYAVKEMSKGFVPDVDFHMHSYEIILYECCPEKYDVQINKLLVEKGLAKYDPETMHILENDSKASFTNAGDGPDEEPSTFDFQELLDQMQAILDAEDAENSKEEEQELANASVEPEEKENKIVKINEDKSDFSIVTYPPKDDSQVPALKALYMCPHTTWYETMCMIYLVIHAPDITDYFLEVSPKRLMFSASVDGELQVLVLDFLGYVEPEQMTHEIRGLNVVVRLVKSVYMKWPRLLETSTKYPWLTYNLNAIDTFQAEQMIEMQTSRERNRLRSTSSETSDSESSNPCETFTPIVNHDQLYDPMEEMF